MTPAVLAGLAGLALVDSTSLGTLVIPLWMLTHPRVRAGLVLLYLASIALFYWGLGVALLLGAGALADRWTAISESSVTNWVQLVIGAVMFVGSFWPDTRWAKRRAATAGDTSRRAGWRERVVGDRARPGTVAGVALLAGLVEAASMLPYLGAIGLLTTAGIGSAAASGVLAAYVLVMCLPALLLLGMRLSLAESIGPRLARLEAWLTARTGGAIWWIVGILGFFLVADAAARLDLFASFSPT